jgi:tRNA(Ile)-lysidine synthetase-like protein
VKIPQGKWLAAVSGGPDSMALLAMCVQEKIPVQAAHVNYHHRKEADEEEALVRSFCVKHGIPLHVENRPFTWKGNFEAAARKWRYAFFARIVKEEQLSGVLIAHQEDDLLETWLMQKERKIVPAWYGLRKDGISEGVRVYRPLLQYTKQDLQVYCQENQIPYSIDVTNADPSYARNRIRHTVVEHLDREERQKMQKEIEAANRELTRVRLQADQLIEAGSFRLTEYRKQERKVRLTMIRRLLEEAGIGEGIRRAQCLEMDAVLCKHNDFEIPVREKEMVQDSGRVFLHSVRLPYADVYACAADFARHAGGVYRFEKGSPSVNAVTLQEADYPVTVRCFEEGDSIAMRFGTKSVHRFFIDRKIPRYLRKSWPVMTDCHGKVIFVCGLGCDIRHFSHVPTVNVVQLRTN